MIKILFLIPTLGHGGAEKALVNLVNHLDTKKYNITVMVLYNEGVNRQFLNPNITYKYCFRRSFPGVSHILKLLTPKQLYRWLIKEEYDIGVSYLEGQTARIISGSCNIKMKTVCWIHRTMTTIDNAAELFRSKKEAKYCYSSFDQIVSVSQDVKEAFSNIFTECKECCVLYNVYDTEHIKKKALETVEITFSEKEIKLVSMGTIFPIKGFDRLVRIHNRLRKEGFPIHVYLLGEGPDREPIEKYVITNNLADSFTFLGYQENPYKYLKHCDLFICSSRSEGFSTAVMEALVLSIPVITTRVSGMYELLGKSNEYGIITKNEEEELYFGICKILKDQQLLRSYREKASCGGKRFTTQETIDRIQQFFDELVLCR